MTLREIIFIKGNGRHYNTSKIRKNPNFLGVPIPSILQDKQVQQLTITTERHAAQIIEPPTLDYETFDSLGTFPIPSLATIQEEIPGTNGTQYESETPYVEDSFKQDMEKVFKDFSIAEEDKPSLTTL